MDNFSIQGLAGVPNEDPRMRSDKSRRVEETKKRGPQNPVSFESGRYLRAIEQEKSSLLETPPQRQDRIDAAREDLDNGTLTSRENIEAAAEQMLGGDGYFDLDEL